MIRRIILFGSIFLYFAIVFCFGKTVFSFVHAAMGGGMSLAGLFAILYHGFAMDMSMSGYLSILPGLILIASVWLPPKAVARVFNIYFMTILFLIAVVTVTDIILYPHWGFHFDSMVFLYLRQPGEALASATTGELSGGIAGIAIFTGVACTGYALIIRKQTLALRTPRSLPLTPAVLLLLTGALFLPIRGSLTTSTMNPGRAFFSGNMFYNHAAVNPVFNFFYSFAKAEDFAMQYSFFDEEKAAAIFDGLHRQQAGGVTAPLLANNRPNIILFILESFVADIALDSVVAPNMRRFAKEGVFFPNFYANSFRTDKGMVAVMSGYPAHPTVALMKYPQKTESLPTISKSLKQAGYGNMTFYYGGDADFSNMRSYIVGECGIKDIVSDSDFPAKARRTKWGAPDEYLLERLFRDLLEKEQPAPFFKLALTLSSHEPFDVPVNKFRQPFLNSVHYTDSCLGRFVERLQTTAAWDNTLLIFVADHGYGYLPEMSGHDPRRFRIPMIWLGGAVAQPQVVEAYGSQNDLAATLLAQLGMHCGDFKFSKDLLNTGTHKFAFYAYVNGFSMTDATGSVIYDNDAQTAIYQEGNPALEEQAKAFFQMMYLDLENR
ncbi:MAG: sulfatase-like hydrolase/transferase [Prevotellaceae bacterium]|jgi:phosphoglycerol transferase MdoB-like AlkP superfamily enzyme|nr:sulfatase-like hydrolase/transferase [Prevotellaceae bacterium]